MSMNIPWYSCHVERAKGFEASRCQTRMQLAGQNPIPLPCLKDHFKHTTPLPLPFATIWNRHYGPPLLYYIGRCPLISTVKISQVKYKPVALEMLISSLTNCSLQLSHLVRKMHIPHISCFFLVNIHFRILLLGQENKIVQCRVN